MADEATGLAGLISGTEPTEEQQQQPEVIEPIKAEETGERPEWLPEKFKSAEDLAASYKNLETKFGSFTGAPDDYEVKVPEGFENFSFYDGVDNDINKFAEVAKEMGVDQAGFDKMVNFYVASESQRAAIEMNQREQAVYQAFGSEKQAAKDIPAVSAKVKATLGDEGFKVFQDAASGSITSAASAIKLAQMLIKTEPQVTLNTPPANVYDKSELNEMIKDPRYKTDPDYRQKVSEGFKHLYG